MIDNIKFPGLRNNDFSQFMQNILSVIRRLGPDALMVQEQYGKLASVSASVKNLLNEGTGSAITDELIALDARRDAAINGLTIVINGYTYSYDAAVKAPASLLAAHLAGFGPGLARESYQTETSKLQKIVQDWTEKPELKAAVTALGLDGWKKELETANTAFDDRYVDRSMETGTANQDRVYDKRPEAIAAWNKLRSHLEAWYHIKEGGEPWAMAVAAVNGVVRDYNELLAGRGSRKDNSSDNLAAPADL